MTEVADRVTGVRFPASAGTFPYPIASRPVLGPTQPPIQFIQIVISVVSKAGQNVKISVWSCAHNAACHHDMMFSITGSLILSAVLQVYIRGYIQKFPDWVDNEMYAYKNKHSFRSNAKDYGDKTHYTDFLNGDITAPSGRELYHL
jgi:hypothetical protein